MKKLGSREITERSGPNPGRVTSFSFCIPYFPLTKSSDSQTDLQKQTGVVEEKVSVARSSLVLSMPALLRL